MSLATDRSSLIRINKEIGDMRAKEAAEVKRSAEAQKKMFAAQASATKASSASSRASYASAAERESKNMIAAQSNQSRYSDQVASKSKEAARLQERIVNEEERERKSTQAVDEKRRRDDATRQRADVEREKKAAVARQKVDRVLQQRISDLEAQLAEQLKASADATPSFSLSPPEGEQAVYDVFISHAWEDKAEFVDEFAQKARDAGLRVWYDRFSLRWGDSLRQGIDAGLRGSYFGVAVLSPNFFAKEWTNYELDGLIERALDGSGRLLPIWHRLTKDDVRKYAPSLAGRLALNTSLLSADDIVAELVTLRDSYRDSSEA
ncbi:toll/interleukin-1 receptor domain-containing protein [Sphingomonas mollis]|uniref:TIR domain-containing protein n=1 Tax=Sphingomonas mollis TaxID=2795726 RepID=A0ABS0XNL6_9SPHN|nr:toll/interleukin-1 receptor domain-containing protein [Sphingomonas sp. BT553]MBJ6121380.1 TIR domain-containing protein [Sphingomonas sp. BT553]